MSHMCLSVMNFAKKKKKILLKNERYSYLSPLAVFYSGLHVRLNVLFVCLFVAALSRALTLQLVMLYKLQPCNFVVFATLACIGTIM